ncbi:MAG: hypothetical protein DHS80DRAFT_24082 [Piptocephalis tieghemiana]|nr:MAG: hypothetical protein DHS80DRAFT_24082 [Piptocephalis tieghemiana]
MSASDKGRKASVSKGPSAQSTSGNGGSTSSLSMGMVVVIAILASTLSSTFLTPFVQQLAQDGLGPGAKAWWASTVSSLLPVQTSKALNTLPLDPDTYVCHHGYTVEVVNRDPMVMYIRDFLQPGEAEHMISLAKPLMKESSVVDSKKNKDGKTTKTSTARTSFSAFMKRSKDSILRCIEQRATNFSRISIEQTEALQVVWYREGQQYRPHFDWLQPENLKVDGWLSTGQRATTFLVYLNEPAKGGATSFPKLKLQIPPRKNDAVFWYNLDHNNLEDERTLHGGDPVEGGEKWAINIWQRTPTEASKEMYAARLAEQANSN